MMWNGDFLGCLQLVWKLQRKVIFQASVLSCANCRCWDGSFQFTWCVTKRKSLHSHWGWPPQSHDKLICLVGDFYRFYHGTSQFSLPFGDFFVLFPSILSIHLTVRFWWRVKHPPHPTRWSRSCFFFAKSLRVSNMDALMNDSVIRCALVEIQTISHHSCLWIYLHHLQQKFMYSPQI